MSDPAHDAALDLQDALAVLERTPATLRAMLAGLPERWLRATEGDATWSPFDVVGHLVHGERANWMPRARHILAGDARPFEPFDRSAQFSDGAHENVEARLEAFQALRRANLAELAGLDLSAEDLRRTGQHPALGTVTLGQLLATWVAHDLDHVGQIARTMAKAYRSQVGPWHAYLSILRDREPPTS